MSQAPDAVDSDQLPTISTLCDRHDVIVLPHENLNRFIEIYSGDDTALDKLFEEITVFTEDEITSSTGSLNLILKRPSDGKYCVGTQLRNPIRKSDNVLDLR